jgi:hypothetical protein
MSGWIKLHRGIKTHWIYTDKRKFSRFEAWTDILLTVNYAPAKTMIKGKLIEIKRGQSILSLDSWASNWNWDKSSVRRFLELLKKDGMIQLENETVTTRLTVCNYDSYQLEENAKKTQVKRKRNADETQTTPIKEEEERKEEKEEEVNVPVFLSWFNNSLLKYKNKLGKNQILTQTDINNLIKLKKANYTKEDFEHAFKVMVNDTWVIQKSMWKPSHFLVADNFQKYLNTEIEENKPKFAWQ